MIRLNLNNLRIRTKLGFLYCFCILIPLIITYCIVFYTFKENAKKEQIIALEHAMERVEYNLIETINNSIIFTGNLYMDRNLNEFLNTYYNSALEYYDAYTQLIRNNNLSYNYGQQYRISIYADNETMVNGGYFARLSSIKDTNWFQSFVESGDNIFLYVYYDNTNKFTPGTGTSRRISIIRRLDYFWDTGIEKIIKIDLDYSSMLRDVLNEQIDGEIYVRNHEYIIFSNLQAIGSGLMEFNNAEIDNNRPIKLSKFFQPGKQKWEIVIFADNTAWTNIIRSRNNLLILVLLNLIFPSLVIYLVGKSISNRLTTIDTYLGKGKKEQFEIIECNEGEDEIGNLIRSYNLMIVKIKELIEVVFKKNAEKQALELAKKQAELKAIQSQVNPHFLFNTLESIRMRSLIKNESETAAIIGELAVLFRKSMSWGSDIITIEEEMSFIEKYINIQKYRFGDKINYIHYIMEECKCIKIPKLSIVTFLENAFIHGIEGISEEGVVSVTVTRNSNFLNVEISDNGVGFKEEQLDSIRNIISQVENQIIYESKSTGILNAYIRLKMYCEGDIFFEIESEYGKGTDIIIQLPL